MEKKIEMKPDILCNGLPDEFKQYFKYVRELQYTEEPNYDFLFGLFNSVMKKNNIKNDFKFDWCQNIVNNTQNVNNNFISTENLFSKLKLGEIKFKEEKEGKEENKEKNDDKINNNVVLENSSNKNVINEDKNNINEIKQPEDQKNKLEGNKEEKNFINTDKIPDKNEIQKPVDNNDK